MSIWSKPSPSDWDRWEALLLDSVEPATAAGQLGQTCSAFKRDDPSRHSEALAMSRECRAHEADRRVETWALDPDASDVMRLAWAKRWQPEYVGAQKIEHGGSVEVNNPDVAAAIEHFTSAVVRLAARNATAIAPRDAHAGGESEARVSVARLERKT